jgi:hypothetical protein
MIRGAAFNLQNLVKDAIIGEDEKPILSEKGIHLGNGTVAGFAGLPLLNPNDITSSDWILAFNKFVGALHKPMPSNTDTNAMRQYATNLRQAYIDY